MYSSGSNSCFLPPTTICVSQMRNSEKTRAASPPQTQSRIQLYPTVKQTIMTDQPKKKSTITRANSRPEHMVKSIFVWMANKEMDRHTAAVIPAATSTELVEQKLLIVPTIQDNAIVKIPRHMKFPGVFRLTEGTQTRTKYVTRKIPYPKQQNQAPVVCIHSLRGFT